MKDPKEKEDQREREREKEERFFEKVDRINDDQKNYRNGKDKDNDDGADEKR